MEEECTVNVLLLDHDTPEDFQNCVCQTYEGLSKPYFVFKRLVEYYWMGMFVFLVIINVNDPNHKFHLYFDFWTHCLLELLPGTSIFHASIRDSEYQTEWDYMPWTFRIYWIIFSAGLPATVLSCIVFWSIVYTRKSHVIVILLNTATPFLTVCEFFLAAFPIRLLHFPYFLIFYMIYIIFTVIYYSYNGTGENGKPYIYEQLDWRNAGKATLYAFLGLALGEAIYVIFWFLSVTKLWLRNMYLY